MRELEACGKDMKLPALKEVAKVSHGLIHSQQFPVKCDYCRYTVRTYTAYNERKLNATKGGYKNSKFKCSVADATVLEGENKSFIVLETNLVEYDTAIFEPVVVNARSHTLCPGIVKLESDKENWKSKFIIQYMNVTIEKIELEPMET